MTTTLNPTVFALVDAILETSYDSNCAPYSSRYFVSDVNQNCIDRLYREYSQFVSTVEGAITDLFGDKWESIDEFYEIMQPIKNQTEYDYIMTRNNHGCGFWDGGWMPAVAQILTKAAKSMPQIDAIEEDGKIYLY